MSKKRDSKDCSAKCDEAERACLNSGEHESVCRMKRVPCDCRCWIS